MQNNIFPQKPKFVRFLSIVSLFVALDQFFKYKIRHGGGFYLCNKEVSFGIVMPDAIFWLIAGTLSLFIIFYLFYLHKILSSTTFLVGLALFFGGAASNIVDRLMFGCVLDYIAIFEKIFPIFNLADIGILIGTCLILISPALKNTTEGA